MKKDLTSWKHGLMISIMDRGFTSEDNLRTLQRTDRHYIVGEKMHSIKEATDAAISHKGRYHHVRDDLQVKDIVVGDGESRKRHLLIHNLKEVKRDRIRREQTIEKMQTYLSRLGQF